MARGSYGRAAEAARCSTGFEELAMRTMKSPSALAAHGASETDDLGTSFANTTSQAVFAPHCGPLRSQDQRQRRRFVVVRPVCGGLSLHEIFRAR